MENTLNTAEAQTCPICGRKTVHIIRDAKGVHYDCYARTCRYSEVKPLDEVPVKPVSSAAGGWVFALALLVLIFICGANGAGIPI